MLRTVLSAIANAEAQPDVDRTPTSLRSEGAIVGPRRRARNTPQRATLAERDERLAAADDLAMRDVLEAADELRAEAALLDHYLR